MVNKDAPHFHFPVKQYKLTPGICIISAKQIYVPCYQRWGCKKSRQPFFSPSALDLFIDYMPSTGHENYKWKQGRKRKLGTLSLKGFVNFLWNNLSIRERFIYTLFVAYTHSCIMSDYCFNVILTFYIWCPGMQ